MDLDRMLGIDTSLTDKTWSRRGVHPCQPTPMAALEAAAKWLSAEDHVIDLGCGTGRAVFGLAALSGCAATGVELDERRCAAAMDNLRRCARRAPKVADRIRFLHGAAQDCDLRAGNVLYAFNPFPASILRGVLARVEQSLTERPRRMRMLLYYPDPGWTALLAEQGWRPMGSVDLRPMLGKDERERLDVYEKEKELENMS